MTFCPHMTGDLSCSVCDELRTVRTALEVSVKLQSHYARLLNEHDGGDRMFFVNAKAWLARLRRDEHPSVGS